MCAFLLLLKYQAKNKYKFEFNVHVFKYDMTSWNCYGAL